MDHLEIQSWQLAADESEQALIDEELPEDAPLGEIHSSKGRRWIMVLITSGNTGGRWAYWAPWTAKSDIKLNPIRGVGPNPDNRAIADQIFNGDAAHFIGMLAKPYVRLPGNQPTKAWVLIEPRMHGPRVIHVREEPPKERYERSKEVYDVNTGKTTKLP